MLTASTEEQIEAWDRYADAKRRADKTLLIEDGLAAIRAWKEFANLFLPECRKLPLTPPRPTKIMIFPIHKTRPPGGQTTR
ncbi:hypothetical protein [Rhizobium binxianense]|uniref:hypothetical protein n=1 Tax=Rhizobium binxianense TaxID=3024242 RepID=UPI0023622A8A|nr:hypothetical protein [Rhizobium sp. MJ37]MDC9834362.1 hypothetical protein [Rhizobium sp. MJ37]